MIRIKCLRILPEIWARTLRRPGRSTRNIVPGNTCVTVPSVMIGPSLGIARKYIRERASLKISPILAQLFKRYCRQIFPKFLALPPCASLAMFGHGRETVAIKTCPNVAGRLIWKRIVGK
jgi:hypothetical protein